LEHRGLFGVTGKGVGDLLKEQDKPEAKAEPKPEIKAAPKTSSNPRTKARNQS